MRHFYYYFVLIIVHSWLFLLAPDDYQPVHHRVVIPWGMTSLTVQVQTVGDMITESNESFEARLSNPSEGVMIGPISVATGIILNDEGTA